MRAGILSLRSAIALIYLSDQKKEIKLKLPKHGKNCIIRGMGSSDIDVFKQIFINENYNITFDDEICVIIDAGANIGLSTLFFSEKYPHARIYAIEPDEENFSILVRNVGNLNNVFCFNIALSDKIGSFKMSQYQRSWGFQLQEVPGNTNSVTLKDFMNQNQIQKIDILKMDIEGSEKSIFNNLPSDLSNSIRNIVIETHDWLCPGCSEALFGWLSRSTRFNTAIKNDLFIISLYK